ncbi:hypothetical protein MHK03_12440, partial [Corynebacterium simulans]|uniref:hypothetical protein n=1 Tax=Corynebacterium simulans TaxID=146827 RepID=UPI001EF19F9C
MKSPNLTKRQTNQEPTTLILNKAGYPKKLLYKEKSQPPPTRRGKNKGGQSNHKNAANMTINAYQINKLNYLQSRPKGPIRHTPHQPNIQNDQHNHNQPHNAEK